MAGRADRALPGAGWVAISGDRATLGAGQEASSKQFWGPAVATETLG